MNNEIQCIYISKTSLPSNSANTVHLMKICEEFYKIFGDGFIALVSSKNDSTDNIFNKYGTEKFNIEEMHINKGKLYSYRFALSAVRYIRRHKIKKVITRDPLTALYAALMGIDVVLDLHDDLRHLCGRAYHMFKFKYIIQKNNLQFCSISQRLKSYYISNYSKIYKKIVVLPDGVTLDNFKTLTSDNVLINDTASVGYLGKFTTGKGIDTIINVAGKCPEHRFYMYGGTREEAEKETGLTVPDNIVFGGFIDNNRVPEIISNMDILLLPNKANQRCNGDFIGEFTSPMKMFEYMASGRPIIASDIPVLREVLNESNCYFADQDNVESWVKCIEYVSSNKSAALLKASHAKKEVEKFTWKKRAENMLRIIS